MPNQPSFTRAVLIAVACLAMIAVPSGQATAGPSPSAPTAGTPSVPAAAGNGRAVVPLTVDSRVHIIKNTSGPSCTGYSSQSTPPNTIRVMVHGTTAASDKVVPVPFEQYVENVLPNEWISSWDGEALKAGAVAVKSYAWYWVSHYGGYLDTARDCFDVTDDTDFQVYRANSATPRTNDAVQATWSVVARKSSQVIQASYICTLPYNYTKPPSCGVQGPKEKCGAGANGSQLSQWGSQACAEAAKTYQQILTIYYGTSLQLATIVPSTRELLMANDFNFQGHSNAAVFDPGTGDWTINGDSDTPYHFGTAGDIPTVSNAGDGWATIGVFRPSNGTWYVANMFSGGAKELQWGTQGDIPVQAHYRGVNRPTVLAVFRPSLGRWYLFGDGPSTQYGTAGDVPTPGHYAGSNANDYADDIAVFRPSTGIWYIRGVGAFHYGTKGDIPVPGDYNGDGKTDVAVYRPSTQTWWVRGSSPAQFGAPGDIPVTGDFNGDGKTDLAVYRPSNGTLYIRGTRIALGTAGDIPIGMSPYRD